jgi:hypothetical protein
MASAVYSTRFFVQEALVGNLGYTVPDGYRAVLRDVDGFIDAYSGLTALAIDGVGGATIAYWSVASGTFQTIQWRGRQVFNPGDIIGFLQTGADPVSVSASGYLLTLP